MTEPFGQNDLPLPLPIAAAYAEALSLGMPFSLQQLHIALAGASERQLRELDARLELADIDSYLDDMEASMSSRPLEFGYVVASTAGTTDDEEVDSSPEALARGSAYSVSMIEKAPAGRPVLGVSTTLLQSLLRNSLQTLKMAAYPFGELIGWASPSTSPNRAAGPVEHLRIEIRYHDYIEIVWDDAKRELEIRPTRDDSTLLMLCALSSNDGRLLGFVNEHGETSPALSVGIRPIRVGLESAHDSEFPTFFLFTQRQERGTNQ